MSAPPSRNHQEETTAKLEIRACAHVERLLAGPGLGLLVELPLGAGRVAPLVRLRAGHLRDQVLAHDAPRLRAGTHHDVRGCRSCQQVQACMKPEAGLHAPAQRPSAGRSNCLPAAAPSTASVGEIELLEAHDVRRNMHGALCMSSWETSRPRLVPATTAAEHDGSQQTMSTSRMTYGRCRRFRSHSVATLRCTAPA